MSLDEMVSWIDVYSKNTTSDSMPVEALQIIAALKAGQAMRDADTNEEWHVARVAWDVATKDGT